jgi:coproporphyrinogen III oxidase-like Fe-S oxidoreductase
VINRGGDNNRVLEMLKKVARRGIRTEITLIYGLPHQTAESFRKDVDLLKAFGFSKITAFPLQIYRGTKMFDEYHGFGLKVKPNDLGILEVCDNPAHDIDEMRKIACLLSECLEAAAA